MPASKKSPSWTSDDIDAIALRTKTYVDVLGKRPLKGTPAHTDYERFRIRLTRAVEERRTQLVTTPTTTITTPSTDKPYSFTTTGLVWHREDITADEWGNALAELACIKKQYHRFLADAIAYGREHYGDAHVQQTMAQLELGLDDVRRADYLLALPEPVARMASLTTEQSYVLSKELKDATPDAVIHWAELAIEHNMNSNLLTRCIQAGRVLSKEELDRHTGHGSGGILTIQSILISYKRWLNQVGGLPAIQKMRKADRALLLKEHQPIIEVLRLLD